MCILFSHETFINAMNKEPGPNGRWEGGERRKMRNAGIAALLWRNLRGMPLSLMSAYECFNNEVLHCAPFLHFARSGRGVEASVCLAIFFFSSWRFFLSCSSISITNGRIGICTTNANMHDQENFREALHFGSLRWLAYQRVAVIISRKKPDQT